MPITESVAADTTDTTDTTDTVQNTIGVLGGRWRATVTGTGTVQPWDGSPDVNWFIAADDRWHTPSKEPTVRQRRLDGAPVIETRIKVPNGDAVHRVWCVADAEGLTIIEIENESTLPFAVAFDRGDLLASRAPANVPIQGIDLPVGSAVYPVGHHTSIRFGLPHYAATDARLPATIPTAMQVARGWTTITDGAGRMVLPDANEMDLIARLRSELALNGPLAPGDDPVGFLIGVGQLVRLGEQPEPWVPEVADTVARVARMPHAWDAAAALDGAAIVLAEAGETRALRDIARLRSSDHVEFPAEAPSNRLLVWHEQRLARCTGSGTADLLSGGIPARWLGANFEVYGLPIGPSTTVSFAVRWHGDRPAVLWETEGPTVPFTAAAVAPGWSTAEAKGETLWPAPSGAAEAMAAQFADSADDHSSRDDSVPAPVTEPPTDISFS